MRLTAGLNAKFEGLSATPKEFPYEVTNASGNVFASTADGGTLEFKVDAAAARAGTKFRFPTSKLSAAKLVNKRYVDADILEVGPVVALAGTGTGVADHLPWALGFLACVVLAAFIVRRMRATAGSISENSQAAS